MCIANIPRLARWRLDVKHLDGNLLTLGITLICFKSSTSLKRLIVGIAIMLNNFWYKVLNQTVFYFFKRLLQSLPSPNFFLRSLTLYLNLTLSFIFGLLSTKLQNIHTKDQCIAPTTIRLTNPIRYAQFTITRLIHKITILLRYPM